MATTIFPTKEILHDYAKKCVDCEDFINVTLSAPDMLCFFTAWSIALEHPFRSLKKKIKEASSLAKSKLQGGVINMAFSVVILIAFNFLFYNSQETSNYVNRTMSFFIPALLLYSMFSVYYFNLKTINRISVLLKEYALLCAVYHDLSMSNPCVKEKVIELAGDEMKGKELLKSMLQLCTDDFLAKKSIPTMVKKACVSNMLVFTETLLVQFNSGAFMAENYKSVFVHTENKF